MSASVASTVETNPFGASKLARLFSAYAAWRDGDLVHPLKPRRSPTPLAKLVHQSFRSHVLDHEFPCVGGKAAVNGNNYRFGFYPEMDAPAATAGLAYDLWEYGQERLTFQTEYATFIASFAAPVARDGREWEKLLWSQLQSLHELDRPLHAWDATVSGDPEDPAFSFSFAGTAFFIVGLHPALAPCAAFRVAHPRLQRAFAIRAAPRATPIRAHAGNRAQARLQITRLAQP